MKTEPLLQQTVLVEVPFHDVDSMLVVWHGHYVKYFELARCKLLDAIDYNYLQMQASGYAWPVIDMRVKYVKPARFQQRLNVTASLTEWEHRLRVRYEINDAQTGERLTRGHTDQVAVELHSGEMLLASPTILAQKIGVEP